MLLIFCALSKAFSLSDRDPDLPEVQPAESDPTWVSGCLIQGRNNARRNAPDAQKFQKVFFAVSFFPDL
jgi:hypothetical protein